MRLRHTLAALVLLASSAYAEAAKFDPPDPRLDKKVTLNALHMKLADVTASLSKQSGVDVKAGTSSRDWRTRQQHVTMSAKDVPLSTMLDQLAKLHSYHLSREGKDKEWSYIIWQDKKGRDLEAEMVSAEQEAGAQRAKETRQAMADLAKKAAWMTPEEAKKLRDTDPNLAYLAGTKTGRAYSQIFNSLSQTDMDLMLRGKKVTIPFASLSPELQKAAMATTTGGMATMFSSGGPELTPLQLVISPLRDDVAGELVSLGVGGAIALMGMPEGGLTGSDYDPIMGAGELMGAFLMSKPDSKFGKAFAQAMFDLEQGVPKDQVEEALDVLINDDQNMAEAAAHDSPTEKSPPVDPALLREVELGKLLTEGKSKRNEMDANSFVVAAIAEATGFAVMLESFAQPTNVACYLQPGKQPIYKILIGLEKAGYTWIIEDKSLRIRPEDWAIRRSYDISEGTIAYWTEKLEKQGCFTLDDHAAIVYGLTDDQITRTLSYDPDVGYALSFRIDGADHARSVLRLYASLSSVQKTTMATKEGLSFAGLSDKQWNYLAPIIMDRLGGISIADGFIMNWQKEPKDGEPLEFWRFEMMVIGDDQQKHSFDLAIPHESKDNLAPRIEARKKLRKMIEQRKLEQPGSLSP